MERKMTQTLDLWNQIYAELTKNFDSSLNSAILDKIKFKELRNDEEIVLVAPDPLTYGWFSDNYLNLARDISEKLFQKKYRFTLEVSPTENSYHTVSVRASRRQTDKTILSQLNPRYTFDRFIIGPNNDFAHAAAMQVANHPAKSYNPLFIYGNPAMGKTHLLQAIAHKILNDKPDASIYYTTSENFTNEFVESIQNKETNKFRKKYRGFEVLLIDDIQFLQQKTSTLEELFHTFNELFHDGRQLIFACDRPAKSLSAIEDRLRTRFDSGLSVRIEQPSYEVRKAILYARSEEEHIDIPDDVIDYIAENVDSDIRLLEGSLTKIIAYSSLKKKNVSLDIAREILRDKIKMEMPKNITITDIQKVVAKYFNISVNDLKSERRLENITYARHIAMYLSKEHTNHSLTEIGTLFGGKAHTTVMRSADKVGDLLKNRKKTKKEIDDIISEFYNTKKEELA